MNNIIKYIICFLIGYIIHLILNKYKSFTIGSEMNVYPVWSEKILDPNMKTYKLNDGYCRLGEFARKNMNPIGKLSNIDQVTLDHPAIIKHYPKVTTNFRFAEPEAYGAGSPPTDVLHTFYTMKKGNDKVLSKNKEAKVECIHDLKNEQFSTDGMLPSTKIDNEEYTMKCNLPKNYVISAHGTLVHGFLCDKCSGKNNTWYTNDYFFPIPSNVTIISRFNPFFERCTTRAPGPYGTCSEIRHSITQRGLYAVDKLTQAQDKSAKDTGRAGTGLNKNTSTPAFDGVEHDGPRGLESLTRTLNGMSYENVITTDATGQVFGKYKGYYPEHLVSTTREYNYTTPKEDLANNVDMMTTMDKDGNKGKSRAYYPYIYECSKDEVINQLDEDYECYQHGYSDSRPGECHRIWKSHTRRFSPWDDQSIEMKTDPGVLLKRGPTDDFWPINIETIVGSPKRGWKQRHGQDLGRTERVTTYEDLGKLIQEKDGPGALDADWKWIYKPFRTIVNEYVHNNSDYLLNKSGYNGVQFKATPGCRTGGCFSRNRSEGKKCVSGCSAAPIGKLKFQISEAAFASNNYNITNNIKQITDHSVSSGKWRFSTQETVTLSSLVYYIAATAMDDDGKHYTGPIEIILNVCSTFFDDPNKPIKPDIIKWFVDNRIEPKNDIDNHSAGLQLHKTNNHATEAEIASLNSEIENTCSRCEPPVNIEQDHEMYKQEKTIHKGSRWEYKNEPSCKKGAIRQKYVKDSSDYKLQDWENAYPNVTPRQHASWLQDTNPEYYRDKCSIECKPPYVEFGSDNIKKGECQVDPADNQWKYMGKDSNGDKKEIKLVCKKTKGGIPIPVEEGVPATVKKKNKLGWCCMSRQIDIPNKKKCAELVGGVPVPPEAIPPSKRAEFLYWDINKNPNKFIEDIIKNYNKQRPRIPLPVPITTFKRLIKAEIAIENYPFGIKFEEVPKVIGKNEGETYGAAIDATVKIWEDTSPYLLDDISISSEKFNKWGQNFSKNLKLDPIITMNQLMELSQSDTTTNLKEALTSSARECISYIPQLTNLLLKLPKTMTNLGLSGSRRQQYEL